MKVYYCARCGRPGGGDSGPTNFGDALTPALLAHFGVRVEWAPPAEADLVMVGSVLSKIPAGWSGRVLGTGFIRAGMRADLRRARVLALRGRLTARAAGAGSKVPLGDPGILAPVLLAERPDVDLERVVVPHYVDRELAGRFPGAPVVDVRQAPAAFLAAIARAREVITSSLHALIAADALGIPHVWMPSEAVIGGSFKFDDYVSAFDAPALRVGVPRLTSRSSIEARAGVLARLVQGLAA